VHDSSSHLGTALPKNWPRRARSALVHAISMSNVVFTVTRSHAENQSIAETARRLLVTPLTVASWNKRLDDEGPDALVRLEEPVNRFPVRCLVQRLKTLCPSIGSRRIARVLARAGLHLGATTVRRMLRPARKPDPYRIPRHRLRVVTAKRPNHVRHADLTTIPTSLGFWLPWSPQVLPQRWPFCWWLAVVVDHYSRRAVGLAIFKSEPSSTDLTRLLGRLSTNARCSPLHLITDHGGQFTAHGFRRWCRRRGICQRFGAIGKYGSLAVVERFIRSMKNECTRAILISWRAASLERELAHYLAWFNGDRPHEWLGGRTPDEVYFGKMPAVRRPRFEPRARWPRRSPCARPQALVRGRPGATVELRVDHRAGRKHLLIVSLKRVA
jgi:putative transposase